MKVKKGMPALDDRSDLLFASLDLTVQFPGLTKSLQGNHAHSGPNLFGKELAWSKGLHAGVAPGVIYVVAGDCFWAWNENKELIVEARLPNLFKMYEPFSFGSRLFPEIKTVFPVPNHSDVFLILVEHLRMPNAMIIWKPKTNELTTVDLALDYWNQFILDANGELLIRTGNAAVSDDDGLTPAKWPIIRDFSTEKAVDFPSELQSTWMNSAAEKSVWTKINIETARLEFVAAPKETAHVDVVINSSPLERWCQSNCSLTTKVITSWQGIYFFGASQNRKQNTLNALLSLSRAEKKFTYDRKHFAEFIVETALNRSPDDDSPVLVTLNKNGRLTIFR
jgi:hypothetical protein